MPLSVFNTMGNRKEPFVPAAPGKVRMYVCGVTVYDLCHIGHARANVAFDIIVRYLRHGGYDVKYVRNFTDIDDKIIKRAAERHTDYLTIANTYIAAFYEDFDRLPDWGTRFFEYVPEKESFVWTPDAGLHGGAMRCRFEKGQVSAGSLKVLFGKNPFGRGTRQGGDFRDAVFLENYWNQGSVKRQARWFDNFAISTQPIGPITASKPPVIFRTLSALSSAWEVEVASDPEGRDIVWKSRPIEASSAILTAVRSSASGFMWVRGWYFPRCNWSMGIWRSSSFSAGDS